MVVRRLSWAGVELTHDGTRVLIDPLATLDPLLELVRASDEVLQPIPGPADAVLLTHLHRDHADPEAVAAALGKDGVVLAPPWPAPGDDDDLDRLGVAAQERALRALDRPVEALAPGDRRRIGPFTVDAVFAVDGTGDPQVSWVVEAGGTRVVHGGDTLWHGAFWRIGRAHAPIDFALLPVNGAVVDFPWTQPAVDEHVCLSPEQAVAAARALGARALVPIHHTLMHHDRFYRAHSDPITAARAAAEPHGLAVLDVAPGDPVPA